jgi:hypothetical protein
MVTEYTPNHRRLFRKAIGLSCSLAGEKERNALPILCDSYPYQSHPLSQLYVTFDEIIRRQIKYVVHSGRLNIVNLAMLEERAAKTIVQA